MKIKEISDKKIWNDIVIKNQGNFLQSWQWGDFKSHFQKVTRLAGFDGDKPIVVCQFFTEKLPFGSYLYGPYAPLGEVAKIKDFLIEVKKKKKCFLLIEPLKELSFGKPAFLRHQPKKSLIKKLSDRKKLLSGVEKDTRYSIKRATREGVEIIRSTDISNFYPLLKSASKRHGFNIYSREYFEKLIETDNIRLFVAMHKKEVAAATFVSFFGKRATYLHAGMNYEKRKICASSLLNYEIMNFAYENGFEEYDFWGIDEKKMPGVTKFKKGFGGKEVVYPPARDIPIKKMKYKLYEKAHSVKSKL